MAVTNFNTIQLLNRLSFTQDLALRPITIGSSKGMKPMRFRTKICVIFFVIVIGIVVGTRALSAYADRPTVDQLYEQLKNGQ